MIKTAIYRALGICQLLCYAIYMHYSSTIIVLILVMRKLRSRLVNSMLNIKKLGSVKVRIG